MVHGNIGVFLERWEKFGAEEDNENFLTSYCGQQHSPYFSVNWSQRDSHSVRKYKRFRNNLWIESGGEEIMSSNSVFQAPIHSYLQLPATKLASKIRRLEIGVEELLQVFIDRINAVNGSINAVVANRFSEASFQAKWGDHPQKLKKLFQTKRMTNEMSSSV